MNNLITKSNPEEIKERLNYFYGTSKYHRYSSLFRNFYLTDGVKFVADNCDAYWLMDAIASHQINPEIQNHPELQNLQFWKFSVKDSTGLLICEWDKGEEVLRQEIESTNFPLDYIDIWVGKNRDSNDKTYFVAYLPSEH